MFESCWRDFLPRISQHAIATLSGAKGLISSLIALLRLGTDLRFFAPLKMVKAWAQSKKVNRRPTFVGLSVLTIGLLACGQTATQINNSGHEPYENEDYPAALDAYREAQEKTEEIGEPYYNAGNVLYRTERYSDSLQQYDEALKFAEEGLRAAGFFNRGNVHFQSQQYGDAVEAYKEVLRMNPDDREAKHNLELALAQLPPPQGGEEPQENQEQGPVDQQQQESQDQPQLDNRQQDEDEQEQDQQPDEQQDQLRPQTDPVTEEQARQILQTIGEDAQTLQERLQQTLFSPNPPPAQDW